MRYNELRQKEVINILDGCRLGCVCDLEFEASSGTIIALVVPGPARFWSFFHNEECIVIPWCKIRKMGGDVILVEIEICEAPERHKPRRKR